MIKAITEVNFPQYATLHQATVSFAEMGERTISTQVRIDGDVVPDFDGWEVSFKGERFILNTKDPQAVKDNSTRNSLVDLTFVSWVVNELKRYFFFEPTSIDAGTAIADKYKASVNVPVEDFAVLFNKVLDYYFDGKVVFSLYMSGQGQYSTDRALVEIDYTYIWDVLVKFFEIYGVRWRIEHDSTNDVYTIKAGWPTTDIDINDHDFEYGYNGGLIRFERQVQDVDIHNILLGRGGEKNIPYRYFKRIDPQNPDWAADPDAIPELSNIYFDRLRDINFRWYVRGWMHNPSPNRDTSWDATHTYPTYSISPSSPYYFAYQKGLTDEKFNPVEYVRDLPSIEDYGEHWGALDDNDDIFPTIQGVTRAPLGRIDEAVAVSEIVTDDIDAMAQNAAIEKSINRLTISLNGDTETVFDRQSEEFTIPSGSTGNVTYVPVGTDEVNPGLVRFDTDNSTVVAVADGVEYPIDAIPAGTYRLKLHMVIARSGQATSATGTFGIENIVLTTSSMDTDAWKPTFDIWVKNIWGTTKGQDENDIQYAERVWLPILGDRAGNEAKIVFSSGFMSVSEDYEFTIVSYPVYDTSKSINGVPSEWRITLRKSDAEFDATGLYIPNASTGGQPIAGDKFFFIGIDMPFRYVELAEEDLNTNKTAQLDTEAAISPTWIMNLDKVRVHTLEDQEYGQTLADRLAAGGKVWIKDKRFTPGQRLQLYVQSITYTWNEPSDDSPYIVPDIEVVLSDKVVAVDSIVQRIQSDVSSIKNQYARISDVEAVVRSVAEPIFLKKTGESDSSDSPTQFSSKVTSKGFRQGAIGGKGWGIYRDNTSAFAADENEQSVQTRGTRSLRALRANAAEQEEEADAVIEADRIVVRKELQVNSLVINQIAYVGGKEIISAAKIEVSKVIETANGYICYFDQRRNSVANNFAVNDIAFGQVFNPDNTEQRYYKMVVTATDVDCITLGKSPKDGSGVPKVGDIIVQYGNTTNTDRQYVIVRDVIGGGYERMLSGLSTVSSTGKEYYFAGRQNNSGARWFVGDALGDYAEYEDGVLTIKANVIFKAGQEIPGVSDLQYLKTALPLDQDSTLVSGGLILSKTIALTDANGDIKAGINGLPTLSSIAAWYGGPMADKEATPTPASYAQSLFRFDGSGYLAGGNIFWNNQGYGGIPGVTWSRINGQDVVSIGANVQLESLQGADSSVTDLIDAVNSLADLFEVVNGNVHVKNNRGFYSDSFISAGGLSSGGGTAGGNASMQLISGGGRITNGTDTLDVYSMSKVDQLLASAGTVQTVAGVSPVSGDIPVASLQTALSLGAAAYKAVGSVASGNTGLVTGGDVYSAINEAVSSVLKMQGTTTTAISDGSTTNPVTINGSSYTAKKGDVVMYGNKEFWWTGSAWEELGDEASWALKTTTISAGTGLTGGGTLASNRTISLSDSTIASLALADTALQSHQTIYALTIKNSAGTNVLSYTPNSAAGSLTLTKAMVGLGNVDNTAAADYFTVLENSSNQISLTIGGTNKKLTVAYATKALQDSAGNQISTYYLPKATFDDMFEKVALSGGGYAIKAKYGLYTDQFLSAGGLSSGGGSGGVDLPAVWQSFKTNTDDYANQKINAYHIPIGTGLEIQNGLIVATNAGTITSVTQGTAVAGGNISTSGGVVTIQFPTVPTVSFGTQATDYIPITIGSTTKNVLTAHQSLSAYLTSATAASTYQPLDADLTSIAGLSGTSGFLKKTAANTWSLDPNSYGRLYTATVNSGKVIRITFNDQFNAIVSVRRTNGSAGLILAGNGYGPTALRQTWAQISHYSMFTWSVPESEDISRAIEIYNPEGNPAYVYVLEFGSASPTFTEYSSLYTTGGNYPIANIYSNVASATKLATAMTIWGQSFDGTANVSGAITGATTITASGQVEVGSLKLSGTSATPTLSWDASAGAWKLTGNFYATGWVSAGGVSSGGGSEGASLAAVWASLEGNSDSYANHTINAAHIPDMASTYGYLKSSSLNGYATQTWVTNQGYLTSHQSLDGYVNDLTRTPASGGNYVSSVTKSGKTITVTYATLPTSLKNPNALTFGTDSYDGSAAKTITAASLGALTSHQTVTLASGTNNGTLKITTEAGTTDNIAVKGLGSMAYKSSLSPSDIPDISGTYLTVSSASSTYFCARNYVPSNTDVSTFSGSIGSYFLDAYADNTITNYPYQQSGFHNFITGTYYGDLQIANRDTEISYRTRWGSTWNPWHALWHDGNAGTNAFDWSAKALSLAGAITGATTISASTSVTTPKLYLNSNTYFEVVDGNVRLVVASGKGFYTEGFISAGGVSSGGGSEGVNLAAVWNNLVANTGEGLNKKIHTAHLPTVTITGTNISGTASYSGTGGNSSTLTLNLTATNTTYDVVTASVNGLAPMYSSGNRATSASTSSYYFLGWNGTGSSAALKWYSLPANAFNNTTYTAGTGLTLNNGQFSVTANTYQPIDPDLTAIAAISSGTGLLKRSVSGSTVSWSIDTNTYLTGNQSITLSGDVSGSGTTSISVSIGTGKVTNAMLAGSIANNKLSNSAITINGSSTSLGGSFSTASITAGTAGQSTATSGLSISVPYVTMNKYGIVTAYGTHTHSISASDLTTAIGSTTYAPYNANGYLPLNGGTMTGDITLNNNIGILSNYVGGSGSYALLRMDASNNTIVGPTIGTTTIRSGAYNLLHNKGGTTYTIWDESNSNSLSVDWSAQSLTIANNNSLGGIDAGGTRRTLISFDSSNTVNIAYGAAGAGYTTSIFGNDIRFQYGTSRSLGMYLNASGNVGFGTSSPSYKLHVAGQGYFAVNSPNAITLFRSSASGTYVDYCPANQTTNRWRVGAGTTTAFYWYYTIDSGSTVTDKAWLDSSGNFVARGAITAGSASDARLKTNIQSLSAEAAKRIVMALNPVTFTWNEKATELYDQYKGDDLGMIAQEVEPYLPQAVGTIFEKYKRLDYTKVISPLVKVAQDHESRIRQLEAENRELRKEVERLRMN